MERPWNYFLTIGLYYFLFFFLWFLFWYVVFSFPDFNIWYINVYTCTLYVASEWLKFSVDHIPIPIISPFTANVSGIIITKAFQIRPVLDATTLINSSRDSGSSYMAINVLGILDGITKSPTSHRDLESSSLLDLWPSSGSYYHRSLLSFEYIHKSLFNTSIIFKQFWI